MSAYDFELAAEEEIERACDMAWRELARVMPWGDAYEGFTHGPHPKALKNMFEQPKPATDEYAVMIDARDPLDVGDGAATVENHAYVDSWKAG